MAIQQSQQELVGLVNDLAQLNFQQAIAIKQLNARAKAQRRSFVQQFADYRERAEQRIVDLQQSYSSSLLNVLKNRAILAESDRPVDAIAMPQHQLQLNAQKLEFEKQLRCFDEKCREQVQDLVSERDNLKLVIEQQYVQLRAYQCELEILKQRRTSDGEKLPQGAQNTQNAQSLQNTANAQTTQNTIHAANATESTEDFKLKYSVSAGTNTVLQSDAQLQQPQHQNVKFQLSQKEYPAQQLSADIIPWLLASETTQRILSDRHAKLLQTLSQRDMIITQLTFQLRGVQDVQKVDYNKISRLESELKLIKEQKLSREASLELELKNCNQQLKGLEEQIQAFDVERRDMQIQMQRQNHKLLLYEEQIRNSRAMYFAEFQQLERMTENQRIGYLQNQVIYLSNFEKIYARTLSDISKRNQSLSESNEELRMYNIQFNSRLNELQVKAQQQIDQQYQSLIQSYENAQNTYLRENSYLRSALDQKCLEIQQIQTFEGNLKQTVEDLRGQNAHLCVLQREQFNQYDNLHACYCTLRRQFADCISSRQSAKQQFNDAVRVIQSSDDELIKSQTENSLIINALITKFAELHSGGSRTDFQNMIRETIATANSKPFNEEFRWLWAPKGLKKHDRMSMLNTALTEVEQNILDEKESSTAQLALQCDFTQTDPPVKQESGLVNSSRPQMLDACQQVTFHTDQSQLLREAYREIDSLNQQLSDYNSLMKRFGSIKQKIFEECYYDDIEMIRQCKENTALAQEDLNAQILRYTTLVDHWSSHKCPTFETYRPIVTQMLDELREMKDAEIQNLAQQIQLLGMNMAERDDTISALQNRYSTLQGCVLAIGFDFGSIQQNYALLFGKLGELVRKFNKIDLQLELATNGTKSILVTLKKRSESRTDGPSLASQMADSSNQHSGSSLDEFRLKVAAATKQQKRENSQKRRAAGAAQQLPALPRVKSHVQEQITVKIKSNRHSRKTASEFGNLTDDAEACHGSSVVEPVSDAECAPFDLNDSLLGSCDVQPALRRNNSLMEISPREHFNGAGSCCDGFQTVDAAILRRCSSQTTARRSRPRSESRATLSDDGETSAASKLSGELSAVSADGEVARGREYGVQVEVLREELFHSLYLEQFNMMHEENASALVNNRRLSEEISAARQQQASLQGAIAELQAEIARKNQEIQYNFVHRPSREEDVALLKKQQQQIQQFKEWYLASLYDNQKLISQINSSERELQSFFGTKQYSVDPNSARNDLANFTKEQLIRLRKQGQTKIDKLFAVQEEGGMNSIKFEAKAHRNQSIIPSAYLEQQKLNMRQVDIAYKRPRSASREGVQLFDEQANGARQPLAEQPAEPNTCPPALSSNSQIGASLVRCDEQDAMQPEKPSEPAEAQNVLKQPEPDRLVFEGHQKYPAKEFQYLFNVRQLPPRVPPLLQSIGERDDMQLWRSGVEDAANPEAQLQESAGAPASPETENARRQSQSLIGTLKSQLNQKSDIPSISAENKRLRDALSREARQMREQRASSNLAKNVPENIMRSWRKDKAAPTGQAVPRAVSSAYRGGLRAEQIVQSQHLDYIGDVMLRSASLRETQARALLDLKDPKDQDPSGILVESIPKLSKSRLDRSAESAPAADLDALALRDEPWQTGHIGQMSRDLRGKRSGMVKLAKKLPGGQ